ncbi:MAG: hypothetical protein II723_08525, partial [Oscillospiraceae bacterium]|nr:hypothetical protein [Oscillospiraceae bacterium]
IVLIVIAVLAAAFMICNRQFNYFDRTLKTLQFDYRDGETIDEETEVPLAEKSLALARSMEGQEVSLNAVKLCFSFSGMLSETVSVQDYRSDGTTETLDAATGTAGLMFPVRRHYRRTGDVTELRDGSKWVPAASDALPRLADLCFGAVSHDGISLSCLDSYRTVIGTSAYICELWLMDCTQGDTVTHYTVYRYFSGDTLCAVRVLSGDSDTMDVYDLKSKK